MYGIGQRSATTNSYELFQVKNYRPLSIDKIQSVRFNMPVNGAIGLFPRSDSGTLDFFFITDYDIGYLKAPTMNYPSVYYLRLSPYVDRAIGAADRNASGLFVFEKDSATVYISKFVASSVSGENGL